MAQGQLADAAGVTRGTMARAERGDEIVSFANIAKLASALKISVEDLIERDPEAK